MKIKSALTFLTAACFFLAPVNSFAALLLVENPDTLNFSATTNYDDVTIQSGATLNLNGGALTHDQTSGPNNGTGPNGGLSFNGVMNVNAGTHVFNERVLLSAWV